MQELTIRLEYSITYETPILKHDCLACSIGCWYTGFYHTTWSHVCFDSKCVAYTPEVDGAYITYHYEWRCPDGSTGYDTATRFDHCTYWLPCHPFLLGG